NPSQPRHRSTRAGPGDHRVVLARPPTTSAQHVRRAPGDRRGDAVRLASGAKNRQSVLRIASACCPGGIDGGPAVKPVAVLASGLVTGVGFTSAATCAAVRAAVSNFAETRFYERGGRWLLGCTVPLDPPYRGRARLRSLLAPAVRECLAAAGPVASRRIPLLLCVAEPGRPGRATGLDDRLLSELQADLATDFHPLSAVLAEGRIGGARAAARAAALIAGQAVPLCLVAGVDSLLVGATIDYYDGQRRLLTSRNSDGFIPGEAGAAILLGPLGPVPRFVVRGAGFDQEAATITSEHPLR